MENVNHCIGCSVRSCMHHCQDSNFCSLPHIEVGTHEPHPSMDLCTDCQSFREK